MKLKHLAAALVMISATTANAGDLYLHIQTADGNWQVLDLAKVDRLTFTGGNMVASDTDNNTVATFPASDLATMQVNDNATDITEFPSAGIETAASDTQAPTFTYNAATHSITAENDGTLTITAIDGRTVVTIPSVKTGQSVDVTAIAAGTYVITLGEYSLKTIIR